MTKKTTSPDTRFPRVPMNKQQIAKLYFPYCEPANGIRHLFRWIKGNKHLYEQLLLSGYYTSQKLLTPSQVDLIFKYLGEPDED